MVDINEQYARTSTFKGFVQFQDPGSGTDYYRLKERQQFSVTFTFSYDPHYADSGTKAYDPTGYDHSFDCTLKLTSDMIDDTNSVGSPAVNTPTDEKTISYWIYKASKQDPIDIVFVAKMVALSGPTTGSQEAEKNIWFKFKARLTSFTTGYSSSGGSQDWQLRGIITDINSIERNSSDTEPAFTTSWLP